MKILGGLIIAGSGITALFVWGVTVLTFFSQGDIILGLIALLVPPADLILPFLISVELGLIGLSALVAYFIGAGIFAAGDK